MAINITIGMQSEKLDLAVSSPISVDELAASLRRAGIEQLVCCERRGQGSVYEVLELEAIRMSSAGGQFSNVEGGSSDNE
jgi:hypothetical protein